MTIGHPWMTIGDPQIHGSNAPSQVQRVRDSPQGPSTGRFAATGWGGATGGGLDTYGICVRYMCVCAWILLLFAMKRDETRIIYIYIYMICRCVSVRDSVNVHMCLRTYG